MQFKVQKKMLSPMVSLFQNSLNPLEWNVKTDETISVASKVNGIMEEESHM